MNIQLYRRIVTALLFLLITGCASKGEVVGPFNLDVRDKARQTAVYWPAPPELPRYRYLGELLGEQNFSSDKDATTSDYVFELLTGVMDSRDITQLQRPVQGMTDESGRIYVVDAGLRAVVVFDPIIPGNKPVATASGGETAKKGESGSGRVSASEEKNGQMLVWNMAGEQTEFRFPIAVSRAWGGNIAVSDSQLGAVTLLNAQGEPVGLIGGGILKRPTGIAFDPLRGRLYVSDTETHEIKVFGETGELLHTIGGPGTDPGRFNAPTHLVFSRVREKESLYVSDSLNSRIQVLDSNGGYIRHFGERGNNVGNFMRPKGISVSEDGITYVIESYFSHLLVYNHQDQFLLGIDGSGLTGGKFQLPAGVWLDRSDRIFVADMFNNRVVVYQFLGANGE